MCTTCAATASSGFATLAALGLPAIAAFALDRARRDDPRRAATPTDVPVSSDDRIDEPT